jgi:hypothetical protein
VIADARPYQFDIASQALSPALLECNDYALYGTPRTYGLSVRWSTL